MVIFYVNRYLSPYFVMTGAWSQRQILFIRVVFRVLSTGDLKTKRKVLQQSQKLRIMTIFIKMLWGTPATSIDVILKSTYI